MNELTGSKTEKNLMTAFTLESQAIQKYSWFAKVAGKEGYKQMEAIFLETAEQKKSHCKTLFRLLEGCEVEMNLTLSAEPIAPTLENLLASAKAEQQQSELLFAEFERIAWDEGFKKASTKLKLFKQIKKFYSGRFSALAEIGRAHV